MEQVKKGGSRRRRVRVKEKQAREEEKMERGRREEQQGDKWKTRRCLKVTQTKWKKPSWRPGKRRRKRVKLQRRCG